MDEEGEIERQDLSFLHRHLLWQADSPYELSVAGIIV